MLVAYDIGGPTSLLGTKIFPERRNFSAKPESSRKTRTHCSLYLWGGTLDGWDRGGAENGDYMLSHIENIEPFEFITGFKKLG